MFSDKAKKPLLLIKSDRLGQIDQSNTVYAVRLFDEGFLLFSKIRPVFKSIMFGHVRVKVSAQTVCITQYL